MFISTNNHDTICIKKKKREGGTYFEKRISLRSYMVRCIACLAVVAIHSINIIYATYEGNLSNQFLNGLEWGILIFLFGTPTFVFISEFLLAKSYSTKIPEKFLWKRVRYLLFPYITMGIIYAVYSLSKSGELTPISLSIKILRNIFMADYIAYFIVVIFQFYILHIIFTKYLQHVSARVMIPICLGLNLIYLGFFNFVPPLDIVPKAEYIWSRLYWIPFLGWIFYFAVAYYCGKNYESFKTFLNRNIKWPWVMPIVSSLLIGYLKFSQILPEGNSKRIDILFYTISLIFVLFYLTSKTTRLPRFVLLISRYSFGIYLLHLMVVQTLGTIFKGFHPLINLSFTFILSIVISIALTYIIHLMRIGSYFLGKIGPDISRSMNTSKPNNTWEETRNMNG